MKRQVILGATLIAMGFLLGRMIPREGPPVWADGGCIDGDINGDGELNLSDPVHLLQFLFLGGQHPVACESPSHPVSAVVIVRHAEKTVGDTDPGLTPEGQVRAQQLASMLASAGVDYLVASDLRRTRETLEPLSEAAQLPIEEVAESEDVVALLEGLPAGSLAVVAHHSYTIPSILLGLGVDDAGELSFGGNHYDNFVLILRPYGATPQLLPLKY